MTTTAVAVVSLPVVPIVSIQRTPSEEREAEDSRTPSEEREAEDSRTPSEEREAEDSRTPSEEREAEDSRTALLKLQYEALLEGFAADAEQTVLRVEAALNSFERRLLHATAEALGLQSVSSSSSDGIRKVTVFKAGHAPSGGNCVASGDGGDGGGGGGGGDEKEPGPCGGDKLAISKLPSPTGPEFWCNECGKDMHNARSMDLHITSRKHLTKLAMSVLTKSKIVKSVNISSRPVLPFHKLSPGCQHSAIWRC
jgi:hypothetical protein